MKDRTKSIACPARHSRVRFVHLSSVLLALVALGLFPCGCKKTPPASTPERYEAAKELFDQVTREYHNPSAEKAGEQKTSLLKEAAAGYEKLLKTYPEQTNWCAQALCSLAGVRAAQGRTNDAVKLFATVAEKYPHQDWEVIQAWKAAGDLLLESGRSEDAKAYYRQIVQRFDQTNAQQVIQIIVKGAKKKLAN